MNTNRKLFLPIFLLPLIISCSSQNAPSFTSDDSSDDIPSISSSDTSSTSQEEEDIYDMGYSTIKIDGEDYYQLCQGLYVNKLPGLYKYDFALKFAYNDNKAELYFNYNGERPLHNSLCNLSAFEEVDIYENVPTDNSEIPLTTSVDAILEGLTERCISNNYINSVQKSMKYAYFHNACVVNISFLYQENETNMALSYLVDNKNEYTIPLVFLSMPYVKWFGSPYYFYNNIVEEPEMRVNLEFYDPLSKDYWQRNSKIKVGGGWSKGYPQRTLNLNFKKDENGNKNEKVESAIFCDRNMCGKPTKALSKFIRFRLHNGGNCFEAWSGFNDAIIQKAMFGSNAATTAYRPCLVYLNGEYWGMMSIREHYSDYYVKQNYGVDDDNVTMFELKGGLIFDDGDEEGIVYANQLNTLLEDSRFKSGDQTKIDAAYQELTQLIDIDSLMDAILANYYACNWDYVGNFNNLKMWRAMTPTSEKYEDGKWRFCLHDLDFAFTENRNFFDKNTANSYNNWNLVKDCMLSKTFRSQLVARAQALAESHLSVKNLSNITQAMYEVVKPYKKDFGKRWGQPTNYYNDWINYYSYLLNYYSSRTANFVNELKTIINNQYGGY